MRSQERENETALEERSEQFLKIEKRKDREILELKQSLSEI